MCLQVFLQVVPSKGELNVCDRASQKAWKECGRPQSVPLASFSKSWRRKRHDDGDNVMLQWMICALQGYSQAAWRGKTPLVD